MNCVGTEPELLECFHASIGKHLCGTNNGAEYSDIIISCYGKLNAAKNYLAANVMYAIVLTIDR